MRKVQGLCIRLIHQSDRLCDRLHTFGHNTKLAEESGQRPHDPSRHRIQTQHQGCRRCDNTDGDRTLHPKINRPADDTDHQQTVQDDQRQVHDRVNPHLDLKRRARLFNRFFGVFQLAVVVREHFDRMNIRIGVNNPSGDFATCVRRRLTGRANPFDRPGNQASVKEKPDDQGKHQSCICRDQQNARTDQICDRIGNRVKDLEHHFARCGRRLHDPVGNSAREIVFEPPDGLAQNVFMRSPTDQRPKVGQNCIVQQQHVDQLNKWP